MTTFMFTKLIYFYTFCALGLHFVNIRSCHESGPVMGPDPDQQYLMNADPGQ